VDGNISTGAAQLNGLQKAAIVLMEIGVESSVEITKRLSQRNLPNLTRELKNVSSIPEEQRREVIKQFMAHFAKSGGGIEGDDFAHEVLKRTLESSQFKALDFMQTADRSQVLEIIAEEHPQVGAFILAYLPPKVASNVMAALPRDTQADLALRLATMHQPSTEALEVLDHVLESRLNILTKGPLKVGGVNNLVQILRNAGRNTESLVLETFAEKRPDLAEQAKKMMLVFEDLLRLDDMSFQKILKQIDGKTLALALKRTSSDIEALVMRNLSERVREMLLSDMEALGKVRVTEVMEAQQKIVECFRNLERTGEVVLLDPEEELV
jgi:flagellar motor switch protein FliG